MNHRYLEPIIRNDALKDHKMAFISGPRQVGKTSLAFNLIKHTENYFNWDESEFKRSWIQSPLKSIESINDGPVIFDEIHKYRYWKNSLKGLYDHLGKEIPIIVTGSARLDHYKKGGDSLMGRYIPYRLHPITISERTKNFPDPDQLQTNTIKYPLQDLIACSGFPEPLLKGSEAKAKRWSRLRLDQFLREDVRDFKNIRDLEMLRLLVTLLPHKVGSPLSLNSLREDLQVAYATIREWMMILRELYLCFQVSPYSKNIARSLSKESKYYLYDTLSINNEGALLENIVAIHLLKVCHFWTDCAYGDFQLHYIRTKDKLEVDFCILRNGKVWMLIECKSNDISIHPGLKKMAALFTEASAFQLTQKKKIDRKIPGTKIRLISVDKFLSMFI